MNRLLCSGLMALLTPFAHAAIVVTSDDAGTTSRHYFERGEVLVLRQGEPAFGIDQAGNCWFVDRRRLVSDPCERMLESVTAMHDRAKASMDPQQRAMMQQWMASSARQQPVEVRPKGSRKIAGYPAACHAIGADRELCVSAQLLREITDVLGDRRLVDMFAGLAERSSSFAGGDATGSAVAELYRQGYPMADLRRQAALPGLDPSLLQYLPEAQRAQVMQQLGAAGGGMPRGVRVTDVEKGVRMPRPDLSRYQRQGFDQYLRDSMSALPGRR